MEFVADYRISSRFFSLRTSTLICFQFWKLLHQRNGLKWGVFCYSYIFKSPFVGVNNCINKLIVQFSHSVMSDSATSWTAARQASLSIINSQSLLKLTSVQSGMLSNHLILRHPLLLPPSIFPSIMVFSSESVPCIRWPEYWSFSFSISPSKEYSGLISFRIDWFDLLAVQGTLKSFLQH